MKNKQLPLVSVLSGLANPTYRPPPQNLRSRNNVNRAKGMDCLGGNGSCIPDCEVVPYGRTVMFGLFLQD